MMRMTVDDIVRREICLSDKDIKRVVNRAVRDRFSLPACDYFLISDGKVIACTEKGGGSHSWTDRTDITKDLYAEQVDAVKMLLKLME